MTEQEQYRAHLDECLRALSQEIERDAYSRMINRINRPLLVPFVPWHRRILNRILAARHWLARKIDPFKCDCWED